MALIASNVFGVDEELQHSAFPIYLSGKHKIRKTRVMNGHVGNLLFSRVLRDSTPRFVSWSVGPSVDPSVTLYFFCVLEIFGFTAPISGLVFTVVTDSGNHLKF